VLRYQAEHRRAHVAFAGHGTESALLSQERFTLRQKVEMLLDAEGIDDADVHHRHVALFSYVMSYLHVNQSLP
jgi:hypothetical protein